MCFGYVCSVTCIKASIPYGFTAYYHHHYHYEYSNDRSHLYLHLVVSAQAIGSSKQLLVVPNRMNNELEQVLRDAIKTAWDHGHRVQNATIGHNFRTS